jgi:glycosyltransferase involved in cell wall biosynthesis
LPVITTRANGFSEIIQDRVHGSIIGSPPNTGEICDALRFWASAERRSVARPLIVELAAGFDISVNVRRTLAVLRHVPRADSVSGKIRKT